MNDDTFDPTHGAPDDDLTALEAVSAFVDGTATADERSLVESSPALQALAARWSEQRDLLADEAAGPSDTVREAGLAAAMAVYDELYPATGSATSTSTSTATSTDVPASATVLRFERRQRQQRWLMGAAAAVVVLFVGGLVASGGIGGSDRDTSTVADAPTTAAAGEVDTMADATAKADPAVSPMLDDALATEAAGDALAETGVAATASTAAGASTETMAPEQTTFGEGAGGGVGGDDGITGPAEVLETLSSEPELLAFAAARTAQLPLPGLEFPCVEPAAEAMGTARYRGVDVVVVRDPTTDEVRALDLATCDVVASARP